MALEQATLIAQVEGTQTRGLLVWDRATSQFLFVLVGDEWRIYLKAPSFEAIYEHAQAAVQTIDPAAEWRMLGGWGPGVPAAVGDVAIAA